MDKMYMVQNLPPLRLDLRRFLESALPCPYLPFSSSVVKLLSKGLLILGDMVAGWYWASRWRSSRLALGRWSRGHSTIQVGAAAAFGAVEGRYSSPWQIRLSTMINVFVDTRLPSQLHAILVEKKMS